MIGLMVWIGISISTRHKIHHEGTRAQRKICDFVPWYLCGSSSII